MNQKQLDILSMTIFHEPHIPKEKKMKKKFTAMLWPEEEMYIAQCMQVNVVSQGETEIKALANLQEALELYFEEPTAKLPQKMETIEVEINAA